MVIILALVTVLSVILVNEVLLKRRYVTHLASDDKAGTIKLPKKIDYPEELHFTRSHTWASISKALVTIGLDDFTQRLAGRIDRIEAIQPGEMVKKGQPVWVIHFGDKSVAQKAPISGRVAAVNVNVLRDPSLINQAPYSEGWILKLAPLSLIAETSELLNPGDFRKWNDQIRNKLLESVLPELGAVYGDASELRQGAGRIIEPEKWARLVEVLFNEND